MRFTQPVWTSLKTDEEEAIKLINWALVPVIGVL